MLQEQLYYQKKKSAMGYSTQYASSGVTKSKEPSSSSSSYPKKEVTEHQSRPATTQSKGSGSFKRSSTGNKRVADAEKYKSAAEREKYKKYYHSKTYKM